ncbi:conjugal transfer protein [Acidithiobacillus ferrooxidans]|uniref:TrbI/VirB10 family protein n=1 Tax=Acidithiobacillus ferrooxidans TaxID=920 RepID=UPI002147EB7A|nr:TrbI/VirB10 family protein [Acidithiobacillus ferrooxidans]MCR1346250.1 conjugal transfer protein [Acidithiobacillus ferrooxidans]MCR1355553.1 conjugal transfer protein [Acidithiobacillus ferrooxidans]
MKPKEQFKLWWKTQPPERKQKIKFAGLAVGVIGAVVIGTNLSGFHHHQDEEAALKKAEAVSSDKLTVPRAQNITPQSLQAQIASTQKQLKSLTKIIAEENGVKSDQMKDLKGQMSQEVLKEIQENEKKHSIQLQNPATQRQIADLTQEIKSLKAEKQQPVYNQVAPGVAPAPSIPVNTWSPAQPIEILGEGGAAASQAANGNGVAPPTAPVGAPGTPTAPAIAGRRPTVSYHQPKTLKQLGGAVKVSNKKTGIYLPASTILTGVLINGVIAGTGPDSKHNPQIVDIRIKKKAILPNGLRINLENCEVLASGYGSMNERRVFMRTDTLSCVDRRTGNVISAPIHAYVVSSGGHGGVPGKVISHQGPAMLKSFLSGIFSGIGNAIQPNQVDSLNLNPSMGSQQSYQLPSMGYMGGSALAGGISTPAGEISKFYLHEAESELPTIEVNPGVSVSMIVETGVRVHVHGETKGQLAEAQYQSASSISNSPQGGPALTPGESMQSPYGMQSPYAGNGQSSAVRDAFPSQTAARQPYAIQPGEQQP